jgi:hypothetical protein
LRDVSSRLQCDLIGVMVMALMRLRQVRPGQKHQDQHKDERPLCAATQQHRRDQTSSKSHQRHNCGAA